MGLCGLTRGPDRIPSPAPAGALLPCAGSPGPISLLFRRKPRFPGRSKGDPGTAQMPET